MATTSTTVGRRERARQDKHDRIFSAASELFAELDFDQVTTQQIAERADIGVGTLFRYAATKGELFLMVYNERFASAVETGARAAARESDPASALCALVDPVLAWSRSLAASADYQRELLFGPPGIRYRDEGLAIVARLEAQIAEVLLAGQVAPAETAVREARRAARTVFAILNLSLVQPFNNLNPEAEPGPEMHAQIAQVVRGYLATVDSPEAPVTT